MLGRALSSFAARNRKQSNNYPLSGLTVYFDVTRGGWTFRNSIYNGSGYNGLTAHDNPLLVRPKKDGIFNISQLEYSYRGGRYFAGVAVHTRQYAVDDEGEMAPAEEAAIFLQGFR